MTRTSQPLVSIVTPVYNGEEYFVECIESILAQTYQNWDYTILNNCSADRSMEIARQYAARDERIRIVENEQFLPVIANHNAALRQISPDSKYCKMVFADDWIYPECIARMVAVAEENPSVGIVSAYVLQGPEVKCVGLPYQARVFGGREICRRHLLDHLYVFESANALLYRSDLVRTKAAFYNEQNIHADTEACFALLRSADFGFVHQILTYTRIRPGSERATSSDLQTYLSGMLQVLQGYGSKYLSPEELDRLLRAHISDYYKFLGKCVLLGQRNVLNYHRAKLINSGIGFQWSRVVLGMVSTLLSLASRPGFIAGRLIKSGNQATKFGPEQKEWDGAIAADTVGTRRAQ